MSIEAPRDPNLIIDDLGFRMAWLEKTVIMNIKKLDEIVARNLATPEALRQAARDLADDTRNNLIELQVCAAERLLVVQRVADVHAGTADILAFPSSVPTSAKLPQPTMVPA